MTRFRADAALALTAFIWGVAFIAQKQAEDLIPPVTFVAARFAISGLALAPFAWFEVRAGGKMLDGRAWRLAGAIGLTLIIGSVLQQVGLATTSATHGGFLTACYVVLTPLAVWALVGRRPRAIVAVAAGLSLMGAWLLAGGDTDGGVNVGDGLILLSDIAWALGIAMTPMFLQRAARPFTLAFVQYAMCATLAGLAAPLVETSHLADFQSAFWPLMFAGLASCGVAFTLQIVAQRYAPPAEAAIILSLESVFAAVAAAWLLGEQLTPVAAVGCALILASVALVELGPSLLMGLRRAFA